MTEERPKECTRELKVCDKDCVWPTCMSEEDQNELAEKIMKDLY